MFSKMSSNNEYKRQNYPRQMALRQLPQVLLFNNNSSILNGIYKGIQKQVS